MNAIKQWFASKGGLAHILAGLFAAAMTAYALNPQFHALVNQIHSQLPGWAQEVASALAIIWAVYKNPQPSASAPQGVSAASKETQ